MRENVPTDITFSKLISKFTQSQSTIGDKNEYCINLEMKNSKKSFLSFSKNEPYHENAHSLYSQGVYSNLSS